MFGHRWRSYRREVDRQVGRLLGKAIWEEPVRGLVADFEELEDVLREEFDHGCTAVQSAVSVCAMMFAAAIEASPDMAAGAVAVERRLVQGDASSDSELEALMRRFLQQAERLLQKGLIDDRLFTFASSEILGTLEGMDADERLTHRFVGMVPDTGGGAPAH